ncbi:hypothetical protein [Streptomyces sp. SM11]|uniref:hypothetical protein n=1 Tax=Streptomyces sp. SM11 TaxID=565557 RepID=UPI002155FEBC|nr:hypothetical protein [Streptomyces sp. SM11]
MAGEGDLEVSPAAVKNIQDGLRKAIAELRETGDAAGASMGSGFEDLSMTGMEAGHMGLATDFEDFCERWEWGVRSLVQNASALAGNLGIAAGTPASGHVRRFSPPAEGAQDGIAPIAQLEDRNGNVILFEYAADGTPPWAWPTAPGTTCASTSTGAASAPSTSPAARASSPTVTPTGT